MTAPRTARTERSTSLARCGASSLATTVAPLSRASAPRSAALPPGPAHRSSHRSTVPVAGEPRSAAARASVTSWLPSSCTPTRPSATPGTAAGSLPGRTTAVGAQRPGVPCVSVTTSSGSARPGRATRVTRGAVLSASSSAGRSSAVSPLPTSDSRSARTIHAGWLWVAASAAVSSGASTRRSSSHASRSRSPTRRSTALTNCAAPLPMRSRTRPTVSDTAACGGTRIPRSWWAPSRSASSTGGSVSVSGRDEQTDRIASYRPRSRSVP